MIDKQEIGKRILLVRKQNNLNQIDFAKRLEITQQALSLIEKGNIAPSLELLQKITKTFNISYSDLIDEITKVNQVEDKAGKYIGNSKELPGKSKIPYYEVLVTGGAVEQWDGNVRPIDPSYFITIPHFVDCDLAVRVSGDSMYPKFRNGDIIICKRIKNKSIVMNGETFLVVTRDSDYRTVKYVHKDEMDDSLLVLSSENPDKRYMPVKIKKEDVLELYIIRGKIEVI